MVAPAPASAKSKAGTEAQNESESSADPTNADNDGAAEDTARAPVVPAAAQGAEAKARASGPTAGAAPTLASVRLLLKRGDADGALAGLYRLRAQRPPAERASMIARWIGHVYFDRRWWTDALREYRFAITLDRSARSDTTLIHNAVRALGDPATASRARRLLSDYVGKSATASLRRAADAGASPLLRRNAQLLAADLEGHPGKRRAAR